MDSDPEKVVFLKIQDFSDETEKIKLWAKNQTTSNIFGSYLDESNNVRKSYFDFILKFNNGFYLYIEVKSDPDINVEKTSLLKNLYKNN